MLKIKNKTAKRRKQIQRGKGLGNIIGSIASEAMNAPPTAPTPTPTNTKDIMYASEIAAKELIQKICAALNPPGSQAFLNIATNSLKTYLEGEDANKMMNEEIKGFIENTLDGIITENKQSAVLFRQIFQTYQKHIQTNILLPAIMKEIGNGRQIEFKEIPDLLNAIEINLASPSIIV